tara:strand:+ start:181 stop:381 length:201 start_codon:yes stop_codon:yes gene_type:complete
VTTTKIDIKTETERKALRKKLETDTEAFLAKGGKIKTYGHGASAFDKVRDTYTWEKKLRVDPDKRC